MVSELRSAARRRKAAALPLREAGSHVISSQTARTSPVEEAGVDTERLCEQLGRNTLQTAFFGSSDLINLFILRISANFVIGTRECRGKRAEGD